MGGRSHSWLVILPSCSSTAVFSHAVYWREARSGISLVVVVLVGKWCGGHYCCTHTQNSENKQSLKAHSGECLLSVERGIISVPKNPQREDVEGINGKVAPRQRQETQFNLLCCIIEILHRWVTCLSWDHGVIISCQHNKCTACWHVEWCRRTAAGERPFTRVIPLTWTCKVHDYTNKKLC